MSYLEKFFDGVLEELHSQCDGLPLERVKKGARELLEESLLDLDDAAQGLHSALRELVSWSEDLLNAAPQEGP